MEDELFKRYAMEKKETDEKLKNLERDLKYSKDIIRELEDKVHILEDVARLKEKESPDSLQAKVIEYNRRIALLDVNLIRLARKYDNILEEYNNMKSAY